MTIVAIVAIIYVYQQYERYKTMNRIYQTKNVRDPNDNNLSFDIDRLWTNNFKIEVTQNYEDSGMWNVCAFDNNGDYFNSYDCKNEKEVLDIIREISKEEMEEENESY